MIVVGDVLSKIRTNSTNMAMAMKVSYLEGPILGKIRSKQTDSLKHEEPLDVLLLFTI